MRFLIIVLACLIVNVCATTWNEPWTEDVIKNSDSFIEIEVLSTKPLKVKVIKTWAGKKLSGELKVAGYHMLQIGSTTYGVDSSYEMRLPFGEKQKVFCFVKEKKGEIFFPTPTSGYATFLEEDVLLGTFRHSYHKVLISSSDYTKAMVAIFNTLHGLQVDANFVDLQMEERLLSGPSFPENRECNTPKGKLFFAQHTTLELLHFFGKENHCDIVIPFLKDYEKTSKDDVVLTASFHHRISAVRALSKIGGKKAIDALLNTIENDSSDFVKVMAVWALSRLKAKSALDKLKQLQPQASTEDNGFGGNIMDPRVGTYFPTVKDAITNAIKKLENKQVM